MKNPILLLSFLFLSYALPAQKVAALPDKEKILIGEQIHLNVFGEFNQGEPVSWFTADTLLHFEILERSNIDTIKNESTGATTLKQTLLITSWDSGKWDFPPLSIGKINTLPFQIEVGYSPMKPNQPYNDIKDIISVAKPKESKWYWYFVLIIVLIALFLLFFPPEKKKEKPAFTPDINAYQKALQELDQLEAGQEPDDKIFFTRLVNVLRAYLHKTKNIESFSKTTDDLAIQMKKLDLDVETYSPLLQTLRLSDLVKYARFQSTGEDKKSAVGTIRKTIITIENPNAV